MRLKNALLSEQRKLLEDLYMEAFPKEERKPFKLMVDKTEKGEMEILSIESETGEFCGLVINVISKEWILLDYFAIEPSKRGEHIGSEILNLLQNRYADKGLVLEIERTDIECENLDQRKRRKRFYLKNGMRETGIYTELFGVEMELLTDGETIGFEEYYKIYADVFGNYVSGKVLQL